MRTQSLQWFRRLPKIMITYQTTTQGTVYDPVTGSYNNTITDTQELVYIGEFTTQDVQLLSTLNNIDNNLTENSRKLISLTKYDQDTIIKIGTDDYRIAFKQEKAGAWLYGIDRL